MCGRETNRCVNRSSGVEVGGGEKEDENETRSISGGSKPLCLREHLHLQYTDLTFLLKICQSSTKNPSSRSAQGLEHFRGSCMYWHSCFQRFIEPGCSRNSESQEKRKSHYTAITRGLLKSVQQGCNKKGQWFPESYQNAVPTIWGRTSCIMSLTSGVMLICQMIIRQILFYVY